MITAGAVGFLLLERKPRTAVFLLLAIIGGTLLSLSLKAGFDRPRPDFLPHGDEVYTASFPSGHSMNAAIVYQLIGAILARAHRARAVKVYLLSCAILITVLVGAGRVYLGVHWPTDVAAGWTAGAAWALLCWLLAYHMQRRRLGIPRTQGVPQGGPLSPILANLFLHYALDHWLERHHPELPFCRYADDGILHCKTETQAQQLREQLAERLKDCGLEMHPQKTRIVYCKDSRRTQAYEHIQFDFLGYAFRPRRSATRQGQIFTGFSPAVSQTAMKAMRQSLRQRRLFKHSELSIEELAALLASPVRGWMAYYCRFRGSEFQTVADYIDHSIVRWAMRKYKRLRGHKYRAFAWLDRLKRKSPALFPHWCGRGASAPGP